MIKMSGSIPGLVETSANFASIIEENNNIELSHSIRSSIDSSKYAGKKKL
jgi:hypothetical protein